MKVTNSDGVVTITSANAAEEHAMRRFFGGVPINHSFKYGGRFDDPVWKKDGLCGIKIGEGNKLLSITGSSKEDAMQVSRTRDGIFYGSSGIYLLEVLDLNGVTVKITLDYCKICNAPMSTWLETHWNVCNKCSQECEHEYERGMLAGGFGIAMGEHCSKCGRTNPEYQSHKQLSREERISQVESEMGVFVVER